MNTDEAQAAKDTGNTLSHGDVIVYSEGLLCLSACGPDYMTPSEVALRVNERSSGTHWHLSPDPTFATGEPNPSRCERDSRRRHYLFQC